MSSLRAIHYHTQTRPYSGMFGFVQEHAPARCVPRPETFVATMLYGVPNRHISISNREHRQLCSALIKFSAPTSSLFTNTARVSCESFRIL